MIPRRHDMVVTRWGARFMGRRFPVAIGRGGMTDDKREGDGATPRGIWHLVGGAYRADRLCFPASSLNLNAIGPMDIWSDDPDDPAYNHGTRAQNYVYSHEKMRMTAPLYDIVLFSDWNYPNTTAGEGSAIFVHQWRKPRHPTAGCLAFAPNDLRWFLERWTPHSRIIVK